MSNIAKVSCDCCGKTENVMPEVADRGWPDGWMSMRLSFVESIKDGARAGESAVQIDSIHVCPSCRVELAKFLARLDENALELIRTGKAKHS